RGHGDRRLPSRHLGLILTANSAARARRTHSVAARALDRLFSNHLNLAARDRATPGTSGAAIACGSGRVPVTIVGIVVPQGVASGPLEAGEVIDRQFQFFFHDLAGTNDRKGTGPNHVSHGWARIRDLALAVPDFHSDRSRSVPVAERPQDRELLLAGVADLGDHLNVLAGRSALRNRRQS